VPGPCSGLSSEFKLAPVKLDAVFQEPVRRVVARGSIGEVGESIDGLRPSRGEALGRHAIVNLLELEEGRSVRSSSRGVKLMVRSSGMEAVDGQGTTVRKPYGKHCTREAGRCTARGLEG
jgi:hypothetical protein